MANPLLGATLVCLSISAMGYVFGVAIPEYWWGPQHTPHQITAQQILLHKSPDPATQLAVHHPAHHAVQQSVPSTAQPIAKEVVQPSAAPAVQPAVVQPAKEPVTHGPEVVNEYWFKTYLDSLTHFAETAVTEEQAKKGICGHIGTVPREIALYAKLAASPGVKTICEIGFNAGHSSAVFLHANPEAVLYQFDIMEQAYSNRSTTFFKRKYGDRFHFIKGSSTDTLPWFRSQNITCDLFSVDGVHNMEYCMTDVVNAVSLMRVGSILIADDVIDLFPQCRDGFNKVVEAGYFKDVVCDHQPNVADKKWCHATVAKTTGPLHDKPLPVPPKETKFQIDVF
eukprot:CAMPEP_0202897814 /NCGR_PEP_ID=MMETSP1392-20130828/6492_1 /ASSEMBLY_ACC=CAM_ASM_000868 /TAXON_ID=225041 /ORGANISM="Chlamydomonas chlamydogama, Strain SAG 11-48b" /LENGTH=338 /DNA_ID=CAMNT_0049583565 /DNA_START=117 /DNA_END=1133 /DNA_ORIENTATION=+